MFFFFSLVYPLLTFCRYFQPKEIILEERKNINTSQVFVFLFAVDLSEDRKRTKKENNATRFSLVESNRPMTIRPSFFPSHLTEPRSRSSQLRKKPRACRCPHQSTKSSITFLQHSINVVQQQPPSQALYPIRVLSCSRSNNNKSRHFFHVSYIT